MTGDSHEHMSPDDALAALINRTPLDAEHLQALVDASSALGVADTVEQVSSALLDHASKPFGATHAILAVVSQDGSRIAVATSVGHSDDEVSLHHDIELSRRVPLTQAIRTGEPVVVRSPHDLRDAYPDAPVPNEDPALCIVVPLVLDERVIGALALTFPLEPASAAPDREDLEAVARVGEMATRELSRRVERDELSSTIDQLRQALDSRVVIEQAKGFLAASHDESPADAFSRLRDHARSSGARLHDVARKVIDHDLEL